MFKYYKLRSGRIVAEELIRTAFEIETGFKWYQDEQMFNRYKARLMTSSIVEVIIPNDELIKKLVIEGHRIKATVIYRDLHNCTVQDAREKIDEISALVAEERMRVDDKNVCRPKKDVEFNHDDFGNGMWYYSSQNYKFEKCSAGNLIRVYNGGGYLYFDQYDFKKNFEIVSSDN